MTEDDNQDSFSRGAKLLIGAALLSFCIGIVFFLTLATQRSGDKIVPDAGPAAVSGNAS